MSADRLREMLSEATLPPPEVWARYDQARIRAYDAAVERLEALAPDAIALLRDIATALESGNELRADAILARIDALCGDER